MATTTPNAELAAPTTDLRPREALFVIAYLRSMNATQAAIEAGYGRAGAGVKGHQLLKKDNVRRAIDAAIAHRKEALAITEQDTIAMLRNMEAIANDPTASRRDRIQAAAVFMRYTTPLPEQRIHVEHSIGCEITRLVEQPVIVDAGRVAQAVDDYDYRRLEAPGNRD